MLTRRLINKYNLSRFVYVVSHTKQFSSGETDPHITVPPEVRLSAPKPTEKARNPFVKSFFKGEYDIEFAAFPEPQTIDRHKDFFEWLKPIEDYIYNKVDGKTIDKTAQIPNQLIDDLRELGVFQGLIPTEYKGFGLNYSEIAKLFEVISHIPCLGAYVAKQLTVIQLILQFASEPQKKIFLPKIAYGEYIPTICIAEDFRGCKGAAIQSVARRSDCYKFFILNGTKTFVGNADKANVFLVFADCTDLGINSKAAENVSGFLVEREFSGITIGKPYDVTGLRGMSLCDVTFKDTTIPSDNLIGSIGSASKTFSTVYTKGKELMGSHAIALTRKFQTLLIEELKKNANFNALFFKNENAQRTIARIGMNIFSMESVVYMTTGMMDIYAGQDCDAEKCIIEAYCTETCLESILMGLKYLGAPAHLTESEVQQMIRDTICLTSMDGPLDTTKSLLAALGIRHTGKEVAGEVHFRRNRTLFPIRTLKSLFAKVKRPDLFVDDNLHPSLRTTAEVFEKLIYEFSLAIFQILERNGVEVLDREMDLTRVADGAISLYVLASILARSSRSYCLGMRLSEHEILMAQVVGFNLFKKVITLIEELTEGELVTGDRVLKTVSDTTFEKDGYNIAHPLARNF